MNSVWDDLLVHYGTKRHSGRYPWGSGENPFQRSGDFLSRVEELKGKGMSEKDIAKNIGVSTTELRLQIKLANHERRDDLRARAQSMRDDGKTLQEITDALGFKNDSSVRALLNETTAANKNKGRNTAEALKKELEKKHILDVGAGAELELGVSTGTLQEALRIMELEGYNVYGVGIPQVTNVGKQTITTVLTDPDITYRHVYQNMGDIKSVGNYHTTDGGETWNQFKYPASIDSNRVKIRYGDEGGLSKDGVIEIRRGVDDLSLGNSHYAQVRILVDGTHYLKGMAMYSDNMPDGVDIVFNTNKKSGTPKMKVLKEINKDDPDNPFGATIKANGQSEYTGKDGKKHLSAINKLKEEGDWDTMARNLSQQFLSKQPMPLINKQLKLTYADTLDEYDEISKLTLPTLKKKMLLDFADQCDSAAVHLKAAALPRQSTKVILPVDGLKETEVFAPTYRDGEKVVLIRFPHGGTFEIPELTVNNKSKAGRSVLGLDIRDAIGINAKVAERLSGADFDGDTVQVIPVNDKVKVKTSPPLKGLKDFDPKTEYPYVEGCRVMKKSEKQKEMGVISNLITDMTLRGAPEGDIVRAVKHSMVVIDAEKHKLDYKRSEKENGIAELKTKWQSVYDENGNLVKSGGASTLLSRRKQDVYVPETRGSAQINKETGEVTYKPSNRTYVDKNGKTVLATKKVPLISTVKDARVLSSGTMQENAYADFANKLKLLANEARKQAVNTKGIQRSSEMALKYKDEVQSLDDKLKTALLNAPRERQAQAIANSVVKAKVQDNPDLNNDKKALKKVKNQALVTARANVGASSKDVRIVITDKEWEAIQAHAISNAQLEKILRYTDQDALKERATPRTSTQLSQARVDRIKRMAASGYSYSEIADALNISTGTVTKYLGS